MTEIDENISMMLNGDSLSNTKYILRLLNNSIIETQVKGHEIIYYSGKYMGENIVRKYKDSSPDMNIIDILKHTLKKMEIASVSGIKIMRKKIILDISDCIFCENGKSRNCWFILGIIAGMASEISGNVYVADYVRCRGNSRKECVFSVKKN